MTRLECLSRLDAYYHGTQYDHLPHAWDQTLDERTRQTIPFRNRRPSTVIPLPKLIVDSFCRALWGSGRRPVPVLGGSSDLPSAIMDEAKLYRVFREATRRALSIGSGCVAWRLVDGRYQAEAWDAKHCTPIFKPGAFPLLESIDYCFPFTREVDGEERQFKARQVVDSQRWTVYKPAEIVGGREPLWTADAALSVEHRLGWVPVVWFTVGERGPSDIDGTSIYAGLESLFDDLNFTASQQARSMYYSLDPVAVLSGVNEADAQVLLKGGPNSWVLPRGGKASLLESSGSYITQAQTRIDALRKWCLDATAVIVNDAEKISGPQSGTALELLHAPMLAAVDDLRSDIGNGGLVVLLGQMLAAWRVVGDRIALRDAYPAPSGAISLHWGRHFAPTPQDALVAAQAVDAAARLGIVSRASAARYLAPFLGVSDVDADQAEVARDQAREDRRAALVARDAQVAGGLDESFSWGKTRAEEAASGGNGVET